MILIYVTYCVLGLFSFLPPALIAAATNIRCNLTAASDWLREVAAMWGHAMSAWRKTADTVLVKAGNDLVYPQR
jgi:hypothetical protein